VPDFQDLDDLIRVPVHNHIRRGDQLACSVYFSGPTETWKNCELLDSPQYVFAQPLAQPLGFRRGCIELQRPAVRMLRSSSESVSRLQEPADAFAQFLMVDKLTPVRLLNAATDACNKAGPVLEHAINCVLHELLGFLAVRSR
jgi:hypothetical protein